MTPRRSRSSRGDPPRGQTPRNLQDVALPHAVHHQVRLGVEHDRAAHGVAPIVVVGEASQGGLHPAGDHRHARIRLARALAVGERGAVGAQPNAPAGGVGIVVTHLPVGGVVVDHGIHVAGADGKEQTRGPEGAPRFGAPPIRLAQHPDAKAGALQHPGEDRHSEARVINVGIAGDEDDVDRLPPPRFHLRAAHRQRQRIWRSRAA